MRKPQSQPSLASLTEADREQLAEWLRREEYEPVRQRVNRPRPEGFGLNLSTEKPLRTFYAKVALLDVINARLPDTKKLSLAFFESLGRRDIHLLTSDENEKSEMPNHQSSINESMAEAHTAILQTTHYLATHEDHTPTQLLALQRLADFPARAAVRDQTAALRAQRAESDQQMRAHKIEMDNFRKQMAIENLELKKQRLQLSQKLAEKHSSLNPPPSSLPQSDQFGPYARNWDEVGERVRIGHGISKEEWARRLALHKRRSRGDEAQNLNPDLNPSAYSEYSAVNLSAPSALNPVPETTAPPPEPPCENIQSAITDNQFPVPSVSLRENTINPIQPNP